MNYIYLLPGIMSSRWNIPRTLKKRGANVLVIGDQDYDWVMSKYSDFVGEYCYVADFSDYEVVYKTVAYLIHKYGRIDCLEADLDSLVNLETKLKVDFNIPLSATCLDQVSDFGGIKYTYTGLIDKSGDLVYQALFVDNKKLVPDILGTGYYLEKEIPKTIVNQGKEVLKGVKSRFFHLTFKKEDRNYELIAISDNSPLGYYHDMINYAYDRDVYDIYAAIILGQPYDKLEQQLYHVIYGNRDEKLAFDKGARDIVFNYSRELVAWEPTDSSGDGSSMNYIARFENRKGFKKFIRYLLGGKKSGDSLL